MIPNSSVPVQSLVDGGYLTWAHGVIGFKSWHGVRKQYSRQAGVLICLDSSRSLRKEYYPDYKSHREVRRAKRPESHEKVKFFQQYIREDPRLNIIEFDGLEADDLVALFAPKYHLPVTAIDKDLLQIRGITLNRLDRSKVLIPDFARRQAKKVAGLIQTPEEILLTLTLLGDKSDDIPRLIPPRNLDLMVNILRSRKPWEVAYDLYEEDLLRNLYLAILPGPWCFDPVPTPMEVFEQVVAGKYPKRVLRYSLTQYMKTQEAQCLFKI